MSVDWYATDAERDLVLERVVDVSPELVWKAWTTPDLLMRWFTPRPWKTIDCQIDLRPGGMFYTVMQSPEGEDHPNTGCFLEVVENRKLTWTSVLGPGYRPVADTGELPFTAAILMEPHSDGTKYTAIAIHPSDAIKDKHAAMGFHEGWGAALDQLIEAVKAL